MGKETIAWICLIIAIIVGVLLCALPVKYNVIYTAQLQKVEHHDWGPNYYYFSNGKVEKGDISFTMHINTVVINGTYEIRQYYGYLGLPNRYEAKLINAESTPC